MAAKKKAKPAARKEPTPVKPADVYVCIRRCFFQGRIWTPKTEAMREKDYLLTVAPDTEVSPKNFLKVEAVPEFAPEIEEEEAITLSKMQTGQVPV